MKRRVSLIVTGIAVILIPTFIMLSFYFSNRDIPVEIRQAERMTVTTPDDKIIEAEQNGKHAVLLTMFCEMTQGAKSVEKLSKEAKESTPYKVVFHASQSSLTYRFYFMENPAYCYFEVPDKSVYRIDTEKAEAFLNSDYSEWIYGYSAAPIVSVNGRELTAVTLDWEYRRLNGTYRKATCSGEQKGLQPVSLGIVSGGITFESTPQPDSILVQVVSNKDEKIFEGTLEEFKTFSVAEDTTFTLTLTVTWKKDAEGSAPFAGKAQYVLKGEMYPPAEFALNKTEVRPGETFLLLGRHVTDPSKIQVEISPSVEITPHFISSQGYVRALMTLGFPAGVKVDSEYTIKVTCPDMEEPDVFTLTVKAQNYTTFHDYVKKDVIDSTYSLASRNAFADQVKEILSLSSEYSAESGTISFADGVRSPDKSRYYEYGTTVKVVNGNAEYRALDTMYCVYDASRPVAVADGKVVFVGETALTGKLIVIDHGNGLRSWYCNLKETTVSPGDMLKQGDVIGRCYGEGFNGQGGLNMHVALTLQGQALDLRIAIEDGILY